MTKEILQLCFILGKWFSHIRDAIGTRITQTVKDYVADYVIAGGGCVVGISLLC